MGKINEELWFEKRLPEITDKWQEFYDQVFERGTLDRKSKELIALAVSTVNRCEHCTTSHINKAKKFGATKAEIAEAISIAWLISGGTQVYWMKDQYEKYLG